MQIKYSKEDQDLLDKIKDLQTYTRDSLIFMLKRAGQTDQQINKELLENKALNEINFNLSRIVETMNPVGLFVDKKELGAVVFFK